MNAIIQRIIAAAATAGIGYLSQKLGPEAGSIATAVVAYVVAHVFHNKLPPSIAGSVSNVGDP